MRTDYIADVLHAQQLTTSGPSATTTAGPPPPPSATATAPTTASACTMGGKDEEKAGYGFYDGSLLGDVVIAKNSGDRTVGPANGIKTAGTSPGRSGRRGSTLV
ncbi:hypothetical protein [Streptomyces hygroscopicus]|uniref:hypothetical protein n=1 Tax=Streptomyces hygroscopicus TaxID=1912 RepID=UPI00367A136D